MRFLALSRLPRQFIRGISCSKPFSPFSNLTWCACECDALRKSPDDSVWSRLRCTIFRSFLYWLIDPPLFTASPECIRYVTRSVLTLWTTVYVRSEFSQNFILLFYVSFLVFHEESPRTCFCILFCIPLRPDQIFPDNCRTHYHNRIGQFTATFHKIPAFIIIRNYPLPNHGKVNSRQNKWYL